jgi:6-phosphogluconolactonase (cycloisomerase 2 family)
MIFLLGTHAFHLHLLDFDPATASLKKVGAIKLKEQPSFTLRHPTLRDLWYVTAWVDSVVYVVRVDEEQGKFEVLGEAKSGGGGPTFFTLTDDGESLLIANVSSLLDVESKADMS